MVVMIEGIRKLYINKPLIIPKKVPTRTATKSAVKILPPIFIMTSAMTYSLTVAMAANEISIPPEIRTKRVPTAMIPTKELLLSRSNIFSAVRKLGFTEVIINDRKTKIITR